jgi:predicted NBD/HSP70 family sugar kinase
VNAAALIRYAGDPHASAADVIAAANAGVNNAQEAVQMLGRHLARGSATLVSLLDPQAVILGGGLTENNPLLISVLLDELAQMVRPWEHRGLRIIPSGLGYYGGVLGSAALAFEFAHKSTHGKHYAETVVRVG